MSQQTQTSIISFVTSLLFLASGIPAVAALFPVGFFDYLSKNMPGFVGAVSVIATLGLGAFKLWPASAAKKVALAAELPSVSRIVAAPAIVNSPTVKSLQDARMDMPTVVTHAAALASPPQKPSDL